MKVVIIETPQGIHGVYNNWADALVQRTKIRKELHSDVKKLYDWDTCFLRVVFYEAARSITVKEYDVK